MDLNMRYLIAPAFAVVLASGGLASPAFAQFAAVLAPSDVALDNIVIHGKDPKDTVTLKRVEATGTNLTKDELAKLFNSDTPTEAAAALAAKMKAAKLSIPEAVAGHPGSTINLHGLVLTNVDAGKVGSFAVAGIDGAGKDGDEDFAIKSGPIEIKDVDLSTLMGGVKQGAISASGFKIGSISWTGFEVSFPDKDTPAASPGGNTIKLSMASLTGQNTYDAGLPVKGSAKGEHLVIAFPKASQAGEALAAFGYDNVDLGFTIATGYDKAHSTLTLDDYTITAAKVGSLGATGAIGGVDPAIFTGDQKAKMASLLGANVTGLQLRYVDGGLFDKAVAFYATAQGQKPDEVKAGWSAMATQVLPLLLGGDPSSIKLAEAVSAFIANPKRLTVGAKAKGAPTKISDLMTISEPQAFLSKFDLSAEAGQ